MSEEEKILNYLNQYFTKTIDNNNNFKIKENKLFEYISKLLSQGVLNDEQYDLLSNNLCEMCYFVIEVISSCPDILICFGKNK